MFTQPSAYDRFMGRFATPLAPLLADYGGVSAGQRVLDVGCGPGALTAELVTRLGAANVSAVDPSEPFVQAAAERNPDVDVQAAAAEELPFADGTFDAALAQLVVQFMADPVAGLREMGRVTRPGGVVTACVWDSERGALSHFWRAVHELDPEAKDESDGPGRREGELANLFGQAGLHDIEDSALAVTLSFHDFDDWWEPFTFGVGTVGVYVASLDSEGRERLRERCRETFVNPMTAQAWVARGSAPS